MTAGRVLIIAEAGVNHNGSRDMALELVDAAAAAGADFAKFQTFKATSLASASAPKAAYQKRQTGFDETQLAMLERLELSVADHEALLERCAERSIAFLSTPFDPDSLKLLTKTFGLKRIKVGSGDLTTAPLLLDIARTGAEIILSTGMATLSEVEEALGVLAFGMIATEDAQPSRAAFAEVLTRRESWSVLRDRVTLLHCTTEYPSAAEDTNLRAMDTLRTAFGLRVGYSDHTEGTAISLAAVARGASVIEKHLTLDRRLPGPDHAASLEPDEMSSLVRDIRRVEAALGNGIKQPSTAELASRAVARKSLVASRDLPAGHVLRPEDLAVKRPGGGRPPVEFWEALGSTSLRAYRVGEALDP